MQFKQNNLLSLLLPLLFTDLFKYFKINVCVYVCVCNFNHINHWLKLFWVSRNYKNFKIGPIYKNLILKSCTSWISSSSQEHIEGDKGLVIFEYFSHSSLDYVSTFCAYGRLHSAMPAVIHVFKKWSFFWLSLST